MSDYFRKLKKKYQACRDALEDKRKDRNAIISAMAGSYFVTADGDSPGQGTQPVPLIQMNAHSYLASLVMDNPRWLVKLRTGGYDHQVNKTRLLLNDWSTRAGIGEIDADFLMDAIVGPCAFLKIGRTTGHGGPFGTENLYIDRVDFDDVVFDVFARRMTARDLMFIGHKVEMRREDAEAAGYKKNRLDSIAGRSWLGSSEFQSRHLTRDDETLSSNDWIEVVELHIPAEKTIVTFPANGDWGKPLREEGGELGVDCPDTGLYTFLRFGKLPDNLISTGALAPCFDMHVNENALLVNYMLGCLNAKNIGIVGSGQTDDAGTINSTKHGQYAVINGPSSGVSERNIGGGNPATLAAYMQGRQIFSDAAGNMDLRAGNSASGVDTATEANILSRGGNALMDMMRGMVRTARQDYARKVCWWLWNEPDVNYPVNDNGTVLRFRNDDRARPYGEYDFDLDAFSQTPLSPERLMAIQDRMFGQYAQAAPIFAQQGIVPNIQAMQRNTRRWAGVEGTEMDDIFTYSHRDIDGSGVSPAPGGGPEGKPRTYFRTARNGQQDGASNPAAVASMLSQSNGAAA